MRPWYILRDGCQRQYNRLLNYIITRNNFEVYILITFLYLVFPAYKIVAGPGTPLAKTCELLQTALCAYFYYTALVQSGEKTNREIIQAFVCSVVRSRLIATCRCHSSSLNFTATSPVPRGNSATLSSSSPSPVRTGRLLFCTQSPFQSFA